MTDLSRLPCNQSADLQNLALRFVDMPPLERFRCGAQLAWICVGGDTRGRVVT
jgi:hypothetical protein